MSSTPELLRSSRLLRVLLFKILTSLKLTFKSSNCCVVSFPSNCTEEKQKQQHLVVDPYLLVAKVTFLVRIYENGYAVFDTSNRGSFIYKEKCQTNSSYLLTLIECCKISPFQTGKLGFYKNYNYILSTAKNNQV